MSTKTTQKSWKSAPYKSKISKNFIFLITKKKTEEDTLKKDLPLNFRVFLYHHLEIFYSKWFLIDYENLHFQY